MDTETRLPGSVETGTLAHSDLWDPAKGSAAGRL